MKMDSYTLKVNQIDISLYVLTIIVYENISIDLIRLTSFVFQTKHIANKLGRIVYSNRTNTKEKGKIKYHGTRKG